MGMVKGDHGTSAGTWGVCLAIRFRVNRTAVVYPARRKAVIDSIDLIVRMFFGVRRFHEHPALLALHVLGIEHIFRDRGWINLALKLHLGISRDVLILWERHPREGTVEAILAIQLDIASFRASHARRNRAALRQTGEEHEPGDRLYPMSFMPPFFIAHGGLHIAHDGLVRMVVPHLHE